MPPLTFSLTRFLRIFPDVPFLVRATHANDAAAQALPRGKVPDPNHGGIASAQITAVSTGHPPSSTLTDRNGDFTLALEPGKYTLRVAAEGFAELTQTVESKIAGFEPCEIVLQLAGHSATVMVTDVPGYEAFAMSTATKTLTALRDIPQSITVVPREAMTDQGMQSI